METTTNEIVVPEHYNPNQLVTYKVISNENISYPTAKVVDVEYALELGRTAQRTLNDRMSEIRSLEGELTTWIDEDSSAEEIVDSICRIFGFNPEKEIQFEATATITGTVRVPLSQLSDFDIDDLDLNVYADAHGYDVDLDVEVDNITTV